MIVLTDLKTMGDRLKARYYTTRRLFIADMTRIFSNCRLYNSPDTEYYRCANALEKYFQTRMRELGLWDKWALHNWRNKQATKGTVLRTWRCGFLIFLLIVFIFKPFQRLVSSLPFYRKINIFSLNCLLQQNIGFLNHCYWMSWLNGLYSCVVHSQAWF